jgi:hypothetical protein
LEVGAKPAHHLALESLGTPELKLRLLKAVLLGRALVVAKLGTTVKVPPPEFVLPPVELFVRFLLSTECGARNANGSRVDHTPVQAEAANQCELGLRTIAYGT